MAPSCWHCAGCMSLGCWRQAPSGPQTPGSAKDCAQADALPAAGRRHGGHAAVPPQPGGCRWKEVSLPCENMRLLCWDGAASLPAPQQAPACLTGHACQEQHLPPAPAAQTPCLTHCWHPNAHCSHHRQPRHANGQQCAPVPIHTSRQSQLSNSCNAWQRGSRIPDPVVCRYHLAANTQQDRREWLDALSAAIVQRSSAGASSSSEAAVAAAAALVTNGGAVRQPRRANGHSGWASGEATPGRSPMKDAGNGASEVGPQVWRRRGQ